MKKSTFILIGICLFGSIFQSYFFSLNELMKIADSFAYLQMSYFLEHLSLSGFGNGWFGFVYSLPLALINTIIKNDFLSVEILNLILWNISAILLWKISQKFLSDTFSYLVIILYFLSSSLLSFHIHILSENIYIPLFLGVFLMTYTLIEELKIFSSPSLLYRRQKKQVLGLACMIGLLYLTRAEAFIYISSIGLIALGLLIQKKLSFKHFLSLGGIFLITFFIFISPYLWYLHSLTGEWGLTNKGASNLRQAELRGQDKMDDAGFEQAVGELTSDKHHLIAGFAGGMKYDTPQITENFKEIILNDPLRILKRIGENQKKLFFKNIPEIFIGDAIKLFGSNDSRFGKNILFLIWCSIPFLIFLFGFYQIFQKEKVFFSVSLSFFLPACLFFTLFFTLNRYFIIFFPLFLVIFVYGISQIQFAQKLITSFLVVNMLSLSLLSCLVYYNNEKEKDEYYALKKEAGIWLSEITHQSIGSNIMERFPIVTYYSGSKNRWITPYTNNVQDIVEYAHFNNIEYLVVDTMDFLSYRPELSQLLEKTPENMILLQEFTNEKQQKVLLYKIKK